MDEPLDETYLRWLYDQVASLEMRSPEKTYWNLLRALFTTEFVWLVPNDDNRLEDGRDLRYEFISAYDIPNPEPEWMSIGCSMLEMLLGLSRRLAFEDERAASPSDWFWHMVENLGLGGFNDRYFNGQNEKQREYVEHVLNTVVWRQYRKDGYGGLFPLRHPQEDQRKVELWYQLSCYLLEGNTA